MCTHYRLIWRTHNYNHYSTHVCYRVAPSLQYKNTVKQITAMHHNNRHVLHERRELLTLSINELWTLACQNILTNNCCLSEIQIYILEKCCVCMAKPNNYLTEHLTHRRSSRNEKYLRYILDWTSINADTVVLRLELSLVHHNKTYNRLLTPNSRGR